MSLTTNGAAAPSRGLRANIGNGPMFQTLDIGHADYAAVIQPDSAFWSLVRKDALGETLADGQLLKTFRRHEAKFAAEMNLLRAGLKPSAVYFNPTERCNLNCTYCYIPQKMRSDGRHMSASKLIEALGILRDHFRATLPADATPQVIFHGAEPLLNRDAVFAGIEAFADTFRFGVQTNATMLDDAAVEFLTGKRCSIGLSLDAATAAAADRTLRTWAGKGVFNQVLDAMGRLAGYDGWSVICTVTTQNLGQLSRLVDFLHSRRVPTCMLNVIRCTLPASRAIKPTDAAASKAFLSAMDRTYELYQRTGRKMPVANFANILLAIAAPTGRRLMCDISPCGGGRCFFALAPDGSMFPCSEFIGLREFRGGNLFRDDIAKVLASPAFVKVTSRRVEDIEPCRTCAIRHFCGSPCPAETHEMNGGMHRTGAFCEFYEEQVRYAFRVIADGKLDAYLWDGWRDGTREVFAM